MTKTDFLEATVEFDGDLWLIRFSPVIPVRHAISTEHGTRIEWHLDLGVSRADPETMEWDDLDNLIQGNPALKFRINGESIVDVAGWFGETDSRIAGQRPDISLQVDLTWQRVEGPIESVEVLWDDGYEIHPLGSLPVLETISRSIPQPEADNVDASTNGVGCAAIVFLAVSTMTSLGLLFATG
mgnify:CR=1 FL=1